MDETRFVGVGGVKHVVEDEVEGTGVGEVGGEEVGEFFGGAWVGESGGEEGKSGRRGGKRVESSRVGTRKKVRENVTGGET